MSTASRVETWLYGLGAAFVGGGATAGSAWLGMTGAKALGMDLPSLNFKALGIIFLSGAVTNVLAYLKQSPLPKQSDGNTDQFIKDQAEPPPKP